MCDVCVFMHFYKVKVNIYRLQVNINLLSPVFNENCVYF